MIENLNTASLQRVSAELAAGRLETLLRIGQTIQAQVVTVTPETGGKPLVAGSLTATQAQTLLTQTLLTQAQAASATTSNTSATSPTTARPTPAQSTPAPAQSQPTNPANTAAANTRPTPANAGTNSPPAAGTANASTANNASATNNTSTANTSNALPAAAQATAYRVQLNVQGKLIEIVTPRPLQPGTQIQLSREPGNRITVNAPAVESTARPAATGQNTVPAVTQNTRQQLADLSQWLKPGERLQARVVQVSVEPARSSNTNAPSPSSTQTQTPAPPPNTASRTATVAANAAPANTAASTSTNTATTAASTSAPASSPTTATNTTSNIAAPQQYRITLDLQGRQQQVVSPNPIPVGTEVRIRHDRTGQVSVEIPAPRAQAVEQALRQHLPLQQLPTQLLNMLGDPQSLTQLARSQPVLQSLIHLLLGRSLTTPQQTSADNLKQQLQSSGVSYENRLATGKTNDIQLDQKALLQRLNQALGAQQTASGERAQQLTQGALSRVLFNQLTSLVAQQTDNSVDPVRQLQVDIPVLWQGRAENVHMRISGEPESDPGSDTSDIKKWFVKLRFAMETMPPIGADISLYGEQISVLWYSPQPMQTTLEEHMPTLKSQLEHTGLEVQNLMVRNQPPPEFKQEGPKASLINIKT